MGILSIMPEVYQGILMTIAGIVLLFHTLGIFQHGLSYLLIGASIYMIIVGFVKMGGVEKIRSMMDRKKSSHHHK